MTSYGYARVSTLKAKNKDQHPENQVARLKSAGVPADRIYADRVTGTKGSRPEWDKLLRVMKPGDVLLFTKLDRIGRSLVNLMDVVSELGRRGIGVKSLDQGVFDTSTASGVLILHILSALAEWEAAITRERVIEGQAAARERHGGKLPIRGPAFTSDQREAALALAESRPDMSAERISAAIGVSRATLYRNIGAEFIAARERGDHAGDHQQ